MSSVIATVGLILGVVGVLVAVGFALWSRRVKNPIWYYRTRRIIGGEANSSGDISIHFREQPVPQVSVTNLGFVNLGKDSILNSDVRKPVTISFGDDVSILKEPVVVGCSRSEIDFSATREGKSVKLSFDFLDHLDGAVVEVTHTGDENSKIQLEGTIRGVRKGITQRSHTYALTKKRKEWLFQFVLLGGWVIFLLWLFISTTISDVSQDRFDIDWTIILVLLIGVCLYGFVRGMLNWRRSLPSWLRIDD